MPVQVILPKKTVHLKGKIPKILEIYNKLLTGAGLNKHEQKSELSEDKAQVQKGLSPKILSYLEKITDINLGAKESTLSQISVMLDEPAAAIRIAYIDFWNSNLASIKKTSADTESNVIVSRFILIREIFIRLATIALCTDMNVERDGDTIVSIMRDFSSEITSSGVLDDGALHKHIRKSAEFQQTIIHDHKKWILHISNMVEIVKILRAPEAAFNNTLAYIRHTERIIKCQLVCHLNPKVQQHDLSSDWVDRALERAMMPLLEDPNKSKIEAKNETTEAEQQSQIICKASQDSREHVRTLFNLLNKTLKLKEVVAKLDMQVTFSGWIFILIGVINVNALQKLIVQHWVDCETHLNIDKKHPLFKNNKLFYALKKYGATSNCEKPKCISDGLGNLNSLQDKQVISKLLHIVERDFYNLLELQKAVGCNDLINPDKLLLMPKRVTGHLEQSTSAHASASPPTSPLALPPPLPKQKPSAVAEEATYPRERRVEGELDWREVDVPGDGACCLYATVLSLLLPSANNPQNFNQLFRDIFGRNRTLLTLGKVQIGAIRDNEIEEVRMHMSQYYDGSKFYIDEGKPLYDLICHTLRHNLKDFLSVKRGEFQNYTNESIEKTLKRIGKPNEYGDQLEIEVLSRLLKKQIIIYEQDGTNLKLKAHHGREFDAKYVARIVFVRQHMHYHFLVKAAFIHPSAPAPSQLRISPNPPPHSNTNVIANAIMLSAEIDNKNKEAQQVDAELSVIEIENSVIEAESARAQVSLNILDTVFGGEGAARVLNNNIRGLRFFPEVALVKMMQAELEKCERNPEKQSAIVVSLRSNYYHGKGSLWRGPIEEKGAWNTVKGIAETLNPFTKRSAFSLPKVEDRDTEKLRTQIEETTTDSLKKLKYLK